VTGDDANQGEPRTTLEARLLLALSAGRMMTWEVDLASGRLFASDNAAELLGLSGPVNSGSIAQAIDFVHPEDRARAEENLRISMRGGPTPDLQFRIVRPVDGKTVWLESRAEVARDSAGNAVSARGIVIDISERKRAEEMRAEWSALVEHAPDQIYCLDPDGSIRFVNRTMPPYRLEDVVGTNWLGYIPPSHRERLRAAFDDVLLTGKYVSFEVMADDGVKGQAWYSSSLGPILQDGKVTGIVLIARDVTNKKQTEAQLLAADRLAQVGTLAAGVAHEINNPLGAVLANLCFAQDAAEGDSTISPAQMREALDEARVAAERVREIVRDLTMLARSEDGPASSADLTKVIESTLRIAGNEIRHRARLITELGPVPRVRGSEARLGQVLLNLVVNAMHAIAEGQQDAEIRVVTRMEGQRMVAVDVTDTGHGMNEDVQRRLFTPFFTTKPMGQGTGLGLSICERIVTGLGGQIRVRSAVGVGSTFSVLLPVADASANDTVRQARPRTAPVQTARVLVIDDEPIVARAIGRALHGHEIVSAGGGKEAFELLEQHPPFDVILCDLMMPEMTGIDFYEELVRRDARAGERVVFLTGGAFTDSAKRFLDRVPNARLGKPFGSPELQKLIDSILHAAGPSNP
jgi:two-component system, cell cycle sensor histidine kinase and response regulator CckA